MANYNEQVLHYFYQPEHVGDCEEDNSVFKVKQGSKENGAIVQFTVNVDKEHNISNSYFKAYGCVATIAACEYVCRSIINMPLANLQELSSNMLMKKLELPENKQFICVLIEKALLQIVDQLKSKGKSNE